MSTIQELRNRRWAPYLLPAVVLVAVALSSRSSARRSTASWTTASSRSRTW